MLGVLASHLFEGPVGVMAAFSSNSRARADEEEPEDIATDEPVVPWGRLTDGESN